MILFLNQLKKLAAENVFDHEAKFTTASLAQRVDAIGNGNTAKHIISVLI